MYDEEVIIVAIVFGTLLGIVSLVLISNIIKTWIKRGSPGKLSDNKEFLSALREFKMNTERRLSNLEAIVTDDERNTAKRQDAVPQSGKSDTNLDIELESLSEEEKAPQKGNLRNMLNQ